MTRNDQLSNQIRSNSLKLLTMEFDSPEAYELRGVQTELLTKKMSMTIGEKLELVDESELDDGTTHDPVFTPEEMKEEIEKDPEFIEFEGKKFPVSRVDRGPRGEIRCVTYIGDVNLPKNIPMYNFKTGEIS